MRRRRTRLKMSFEVQQIPLDKEYAKHKNLTREDIKKLREWVKTQPHLPEKHISDLDLILAYHCCDRSFQLSKEVLDINLTARTLITAIYGHREVNEKIIEAAKTAAVYPLSESDSAGTIYLYAGLVRYDMKYYNFPDIVRLVLMCFDLFQHETGTFPWFSLIIDLKGTTWSHITKIDLIILRQLLYFLEECILVKIRNIYFLNAPSFIDKFLALIRPLMKKELFDKVQVHTSNSPKAYDNIPKRALSKDCGGEYISRAEITENLIKRLQANKKYFEEENFKRINKSLRPNGKHATIEDILGIQGSFKKLDID